MTAYDAYVLERVERSCAAQGIAVVPIDGLLEVVAALLASRPRDDEGPPPEKVKSRPTRGGAPSDLLTGEITPDSTASAAPALCDRAKS